MKKIKIEYILLIVGFFGFLFADYVVRGSIRLFAFIANKPPSDVYRKLIGNYVYSPTTAVTKITIILMNICFLMMLASACISVYKYLGYKKKLKNKTD